MVFELNIMYLVLDGFRFNLLATLSKEAFIFPAASSTVAPVVIMVVSSANFTNLSILSQLFMLLTYIRKSIGPSIDP